MNRITFAIGDIHGCHDKLTRLMAECASFAGDNDANYVFLGDYVDRGPDTKAVINYLRDRQSKASRPGSMICLKGNHEDLLLGAVAGELDYIECWLSNGCEDTLDSYDISEIAAAQYDALFMEHANWLKDLPLYHDDGKRFFCHAGADPMTPLNEQTVRTLLWSRNNPDLPVGRLVVHGHTPLKTSLPVLRQHQLNLDTGAVFGRPLSAAAFNETRRDPIAFLNSEGEVSLLAKMATA